MSKFKIVNEAPEELKKGEYIISEPSFIDEINTAKNKPRPIGGRQLTTLNHLRSIGGVIGELYDPEEFNSYGSIPFTHFVGREFKDTAELSKSVIVPMFRKHYPQIFFKYIDKQIKARPQGTELIYFVGEEANAEAFFTNGIDKVE
jgi:hypothetical protein